MRRTSIVSALFSIGVLLIAASAAAQATTSTQGPRGGRVVAVSHSEEPIAGLRGFSVVLAQGDLKAGTAASENVPPAAAKALADLKDFLPYKSYRLLDTQWTMGSGRISGRLKGPDGKEYAIEVTTRKGPTADAPVSVTRFALREAVAGTQAGEDRLVTMYRQGLVSQSQAQAQAGKRGTSPFFSILGGGNIIDTSFSMNLGETVVVGTSRLQGDTALVVLLTAVSKNEPTGAKK